MSDDTQHVAVDARGGTAGSALRAAVADVPVPAFDPTVVRIAVDGRPDPGGRRSVALAGVAALVALVLGAVVVLGGRGDDRAPVDEVDTGIGSAPYVLDPPPAGLDLAALSEAAGSETDPGPYGPAAVLYGPDGEAPGLATVAIAFGPMDVEGWTPFELDGRRAWRAPEDQEAAAAVVLVEVGDERVLVYRPGADDGQGSEVDDVLLAAAGAVELSGLRGVVPETALPDGWVEQGDVDSGLLVGSSVVARALVPYGPRDGWTAVYGADVPAPGSVRPGDEGIEDQRVAVVTALSGDALALQARRFWAASYEDVEVRGHAAVLVHHVDATYGPSDEWSVSWVERPGEVVDVAVAGLGRDDVLALAERIRPATDAEVEAGERDAFDRQVRQAPGELVAEGTFAGGTRWALVIPDDGTDIPTMVVDDPDWSAECRGVGVAVDGPSPPSLPDRHLGSVCGGSSGETDFVYGRAGPDIAEVSLRTADGTEVARVDVVRGEGDGAWITELPDLDRLTEVVAFAADGTQMGTSNFSFS